MKLFTFKIMPFLLLNFLAIIVFISWMNDSSRVYWDLIDIQFAQILNGSLSELGGFWRGFWAILNVRISDLIPLIFILSFFYFDKVLFKKSQRLASLVGFILLLVLMLVVRELLDFYIDYNNLNRISPSLALDSIIRLSEIYPNLGLKDASNSSFPGDHAAVLMVWLGYCWFFMGNIWRLPAILVVVIFSLPRLIVGAHWLSDILVGGIFIALLTLAFGLYTPLFNKINTKISQLITFIYLKIFSK